MFQVSKRPSLFRALFNFYSIMDNTYARVVYSYARERCAPLHLSPSRPLRFSRCYFISLFYYLSPAKFRALFSKTLQLITTLPLSFFLFSVHTTLSLSLSLSFRVHLFDRSFPAKAWYITPFTVDPRLFRARFARIFHDLFRTFITSIFGIFSLFLFFYF